MSNVLEPRGYELTPLEKDTLQMLVQGYVIKDIQAKLCISKSYMYQIIRQLKYRFNTRTTGGIVAHAIASGLVENTILVPENHQW